MARTLRRAKVNRTLARNVGLVALFQFLFIYFPGNRVSRSNRNPLLLKIATFVYVTIANDVALGAP